MRAWRSVADAKSGIGSREERNKLAHPSLYTDTVRAPMTEAAAPQPPRHARPSASAFPSASGRRRGSRYRIRWHHGADGHHHRRSSSSSGGLSIPLCARVSLRLTVYRRGSLFAVRLFPVMRAPCKDAHTHARCTHARKLCRTWTGHRGVTACSADKHLGKQLGK